MADIAADPQAALEVFVKQLWLLSSNLSDAWQNRQRPFCDIVRLGWQPCGSIDIIYESRENIRFMLAFSDGKIGDEVQLNREQARWQLARHAEKLRSEYLPAIRELCSEGLCEALAKLLEQAISLLSESEDSFLEAAESLPAAMGNALGRLQLEAQRALSSAAATLAERTADSGQQNGQRTAERTADSKTDNEKKSWGNLPANDDVMRLAKAIRDDPDRRTQIDIAREFTNNDEGQAQGLLRQLRRYPHLLNGADRADN